MLLISAHIKDPKRFLENIQYFTPVKYLFCVEVVIFFYYLEVIVVNILITFSEAKKILLLNEEIFRVENTSNLMLQ